MRLFDDTFPLLVFIGPKWFDAQTMREMGEMYEPYFKRNQLYAVLSATPRDAVIPDAHGRKAMTDWLNSPRVRDCTKRLCVGSATIVPNTLTRGVFTALLWFWTPPSPMRPVASIDDGLDYCFERLRAEHLRLEAGEAAVRKLVVERLRDVV